MAYTNTAASDRHGRGANSCPCTYCSKGYQRKPVDAAEFRALNELIKQHKSAAATKVFVAPVLPVIRMGRRGRKGRAA